MNRSTGGGSFREAVEFYFNSFPDDVKVIRDEISIEFETTLTATREVPRALMFTNLKGFSGYRMVTNLLGTEDRILRLCNAKDRLEFLQKWKRATDNAGNDEYVFTDNPEFLRNMSIGSDVDLLKLPAPVHYAGDGSKLSMGRYITSALVVSRNPSDTDVINLGFARIQLLGGNKFAFDAGSRGHTWSYIQGALKKGSNLELSFVIGAHPVLYMLGAAFVDSEYKRSGEFIRTSLYRGNRNNVPVPSDAEIVIEAELSHSERADEGPFAEYTGYMGYDTTGYVAYAKSLFVRDNPIYYDIQPSNSDEHINIFSYPRSLSITEKVQESMPGGTIINFEWPSYASRFLAIGQVVSSAGDLRLQAACGIVSRDPLWAKFVFIFSGGADTSLYACFASIASSAVNSFRGIIFLPESFIISSDIGSGGKMRSGRMIALLDPVTYEVEQGDSYVVIKSVEKKCVITRRPTGEGDLEIIIPDGLDPGNQKELGWAFATRVNPSRDISISSGRMVIYIPTGHPEIPSFPEDSGSKNRDRRT
jgi:UbiD family decarboxylase